MNAPATPLTDRIRRLEPTPPPKLPAWLQRAQESRLGLAKDLSGRLS